MSCREQVVARGAAGAPGVTEALVQQALAGEPGHPAAERHAASLLAAAEAGRARSAMCALPGPPSGALQTLNPEPMQSAACALFLLHTLSCPRLCGLLPKQGCAWEDSHCGCPMSVVISGAAFWAGALALNRKARASGVVAGMALAAQGLEGAPASAAGQAAAALQAALDERAPCAILHERCAHAAPILLRRSRTLAGASPIAVYRVIAATPPMQCMPPGTGRQPPGKLWRALWVPRMPCVSC